MVGRSRWLAGLWLAALSLVAFWTSRPPAALGLDAPADRFSAARAEAELEEVLGDVGPHPVGSPANARVRDRIVQGLRGQGFSVRTSRHVGCSRWGLCSALVNVVALREAGPEVLLLTAHYDSVGAGIGAADDGAAVGALLETARLIEALPDSSGNTIAILVTDGEEAGLLGAEAFVNEDALWPRVKAVVNLEARGTTGPSLMFETGGASAALMEHLDAVSRPHTSSLFAAVYERLPNDTDFSVFRDHGAAGFNFAFIDGVARYHTALDDLEHLDRGSLQHHGDNLWAMVQSLRDADLSALHRGPDAVWFDLAGMGTLSWPVPWSMPLSWVALGLVALGAVASARRRPRFWRRAVTAAGLSLLVPLLAALLGAALALLIDLPSESHFPRLSRMLLPFVALVAGSAASVLLVAGRMKRLDLWARYVGLWLLWALGGVVVAFAFAPACHLLVAPALVAGVLGLLAWRFEAGTTPRVVVWIAMTLPALLWLEVAIGLVSVMGLGVHFAITAALGFAFSTAAPLLAEGGVRHKTVAGLMAFAVLTSAVAAWRGPYDARAPQRMSIVHAQWPDRAQWWIDRSWGELPDGLMAQLRAPRQAPPPIRLVGPSQAVIAAAPPLDVEPVQVEREPSDRGLRLRLISRRGAPVTGILFASETTPPSVRVAGRRMGPVRIEEGMFAGRRVCLCLSSQPSGCTFEMATPAPGTTFEVFDIARELPDFAAPLVKARAAGHGVPSQDGDSSIVARTWRME